MPSKRKHDTVTLKGKLNALCPVTQESIGCVEERRNLCEKGEFVPHDADGAVTLDLELRYLQQQHAAIFHLANSSSPASGFGFQSDSTRA
ncbi:hypothetical protein J6590_042414 [Homalodisca vitripennis]|nr:hypothetical protein J6590_042414 [Homalodisca vitripennis]